MANIVLVVGGSRSGKSDYAQDLAEARGGERYFLATCPPPLGDDPEMTGRVLAHQLRRRHREWRTLEVPLHLAAQLATLPSPATLLIDCLTLWISNLLYADLAGTLDEEQVGRLARELLAAGRAWGGELIMVTNEVGCGLVPEHPLARRYRDLVGRCNQVMAHGADRVVQVVCGIPVVIK